MILVDFDRTLFDSDSYYLAIKELLSRPCTAEEWESAYVRYQNAHRRMDIFDMIAEAELAAPEEIPAIRLRAAEIAPQYLYEDSTEFLDWLESQGRAYTILTHGNPDFQQFKIEAAGLGSCPRIIVTEPKGTHPTAREATAIIDDNPYELAAFDNLSLSKYRMKRPGSKYATLSFNEPVWQEVTDLRSLKGVL